jgi:hypothetical protein
MTVSVTMHEVKIHQRHIACPACDQPSLTGCVHDLAAEQTEYNSLFLPVAAPSAKFDQPLVVPNLTLFDTYLCPNDLYAYAGRVALRETPHGPVYDLDPNVFYRMYIFYGPDRETIIARRMCFFFEALQRSPFEPGPMIPPADRNPQAETIDKLVRYLLAAYQEDPVDYRQFWKVWRTLINDCQWNPLVPLVDHFHRSYKVMGAVMELQLADLLFLHRRTQIKKARAVPYRELYEVLGRYRNLLHAGGSLDETLAGNILFQCLKMAEFFRDSRRVELLNTAFAITAFMVRIRSRVGADINRHLEALAANADVMFYLNIRLGRDLGIHNPLEYATLRLLERRLELIADYSFPKETPESVRIARIGRHLKKFVAELKAGPAG